MKVAMKWLLYFGAIVLFIGTLAGEQVIAADCKGMLDKAKKERSLLKQEALLQEALSKCPKDAAVNYRYGYAMERLRKYEDALKYYRAAVKLDKKNAKYHFGMADIYVVLENLPSALKSYEKGLKLNPRNSRARRSFEELRAKLKPVKVADGSKKVVEKKPVEKKVVEKKKPVEKKVVEKKPPVKKKPVVVEKKPPKKKTKTASTVQGPTLKPEIPDVSKISSIAEALKKEKIRQSVDDLTAAPGGKEFNTKLSLMQEKLRDSARTDALSIDPERLEVLR